MKKRVDDNVSIVDVAHKEASDVIAPVLVDNLKTSWNLGGGLTMPLLDNISVRDILDRQLKKRVKVYIQAFRSLREEILLLQEISIKSFRFL